MISSLVIDQLGADDRAIALAVGNRHHALGAAAGVAEVGEHGALAEAVLGGGQHRLLIVLGTSREITSARLQASCRARRARYVPSGGRLLVEPHRLAGIREQHDVARCHLVSSTPIR
jgi:hypothetical protein